MFGWFSGKAKSNLTEPTALQNQRAKQIDQLKTLNQNVSEIHRDVEYRVSLVANSISLSIQITLPPQFPEQRPVIKVIPLVRHDWVNDAGDVTGCHNLNNFVVHSDLGKVVQSIVEELQRNPPTMLPQTSYGAGRYMPYPPPSHTGQISQPSAAAYPTYPQSNNGYVPQVRMPTLPPSYTGAAMSSTGAAMSSTSSYTGAGMTTSPALSYTASSSTVSPSYPNIPTSVNMQVKPLGQVGSYTMPEIPTVFPQLNDLSVVELQELNDDEDALLRLLQRLPVMQALAEDRSKICQENELFAQKNLARKPELEEKKRLLLEKYDSLSEIQRSFDEKSQTQEEVRKRYSSQVLRDNLQVAVMQSEEEAEVTAEKLLSGGMTGDEFTKVYMRQRMKGHLLKAKEEKLHQYLSQNPT